MLFHNRVCPVCGSDTETVIFEYRNLRFYTHIVATDAEGVNVKTVRCNNCSALFMNPAYTEEGLRVLFKDAGMSYGASEGREQEQFRWLKDTGLASEIRTVLDVGCFDGRLLRTFQGKC